MQFCTDQVDALLATGFTPKDIKPQAFTAMDESVVGRAWFDGKERGLNNL